LMKFLAAASSTAYAPTGGRHEPANAGQLIRYEAMCQAIAECHRVDEVKDIRDRAIALEAYAAQGLNTDAERKAGVLLTAMKETGERNNGARDGSSTETTTLSELGISRDQSSKWQQLAQIPDKEFEAALFEAALKDPDKKPSANRDTRPPRIRSANGHGLLLTNPYLDSCISRSSSQVLDI
jgi:hypothetical protein